MRVGPGVRPSQYRGVRETCSDGLLGHPLERCSVRVRCANYSAFNGYHWTPSDWSLVECECGIGWRTKARYVSSLPDSH